jgi:hypothetical protein
MAQQLSSLWHWTKEESDWSVFEKRLVKPSVSLSKTVFYWDSPEGILTARKLFLTTSAEGLALEDGANGAVEIDSVQILKRLSAVLGGEGLTGDLWNDVVASHGIEKYAWGTHLVQKRVHALSGVTVRVGEFRLSSYASLKEGVDEAPHFFRQLRFSGDVFVSANASFAQVQADKLIQEFELRPSSESFGSCRIFERALDSIRHRWAASLAASSQTSGEPDVWERTRDEIPRAKAV